MNPLNLFRYPAYIYNPRQVFLRFRQQFNKPGENDIVRLPWGHHLAINSKDFIGKAIRAQGIHELNVCEAIARIVRSGNTVIDVGANVGFMTSLLAKAVGQQGCVLAFEPHPDLHARLRANIDRFSDGSSGRVIAEQVAIGDHEGEERLVFDPTLFARNSGTAGLRDSGFAQGIEGVNVRVRTLDPLIEGQTIGLLKIDVEGAELPVLRGTERALIERRIRAVVYEDFHASTSGIVAYLRRYGFFIFHLDGNIIRPSLREVDERFRQIPRGRDENFLAVLNKDEVVAAYRRAGWRVFSL